MIYNIILLSGILLLLLINLKWIKIKKTISKNPKKTTINDFFLTSLLKKIVNEWIKYLLSIDKNKNKMHIAMP
ncbi:tight adherance operon protein, partial [Yersinia sp. 2542 StPb PI]